MKGKKLTTQKRRFCWNGRKLNQESRFKVKSLTHWLKRSNAGGQSILMELSSTSPYTWR